MKLDPIIEASNLSLESKHLINRLLKIEFGGNWDLLLKDMEMHAVSDEEYELT